MNAFTKMFQTTPAEPVGEAPAVTGLSAPNTPQVPDANGKLPDGSSINPVNPLDAYTKMYEDANKASPLAAPSFKIDPKVLSEVSASMDFTKGTSPELMAQFLAGDTKAIMQVIQDSARAAYRSGLEHSSALTETHLTQRGAFEGKRLEKGVRDQLTSNALSDTPNYSHPVVKAELNRVASMFANSNPDASPQQIAQAAQRHIQDLSAALTPTGKGTSKGEEGNAPMDWSKYLG